MIEQGDSHVERCLNTPMDVRYLFDLILYLIFLCLWPHFLRQVAKSSDAQSSGKSVVKSWLVRISSIDLLRMLKSSMFRDVIETDFSISPGFLISRFETQQQGVM